jgi:hypothetical protein
MRGPCFNCCRKHLSQAIINMSRISKSYLYAWKAIGHLGEASDEIIVESPSLANEITIYLNNYISLLNESIEVSSNAVVIKKLPSSLPILELIQKATRLDILKGPDKDKVSGNVDCHFVDSMYWNIDESRLSLAQAYVCMNEVSQGYPLHGWLVVGHMAEAADLICKDYSVIAAEIRNSRLMLIDSLNKVIKIDSLDIDVNELYVPDVLSFINDITLASNN